MYLWKPLVISCLTATAVVSGSNIYPTGANSDIVLLNHKTFDEFMERYDMVLVNFETPSCTHCKKMTPAYEEAAAELRWKNIPLVKVDCSWIESEEEGLCRRFDIKYYPNLNVFRGPNSYEKYGGTREAESCVNL